ncbi:phage integrase SAM-like domain-containing protein [Hymenobacter wooponensis]|uniref:Tyr recombinase domain-containing protein n=1 Tax=Hymenobacter wooponensis TaxID=1525360 RepID=A0A4Z0MME7_9BACT|nr:phage integrase SAM-like domain-containing protein [Hymenobacter wooponensis]TGD80804.1 hypothetical protein EU557_13455 [Hymenobacter wooponensis]
MATISAVLKTKKKGDRRQPLWVFLRHGKVEVAIATGAQLLAEEFKKGQVVGERAGELNAQVNTIRARLQLAFDQLTAREEAITNPALRAIYQQLVDTPPAVVAPPTADKTQVQDLLVTYFNTYNTRGQNKLSTSTTRSYTAIANLLNRFNPQLRIQDVNRDILQDIESFMVSEGQLNQTIEAYMGKITAILNYFGPDLELSQSYKRYKFDLTIAKNDVTFLHPQQLRDFLAHQKPYSGNANQPNRKSGRAYDRVVDILLMLISSGLRYSDIFNDFRQLIRMENGREYIHIIPQKTKRKQIRCKIPVTKLMKDILERNNYQLKKMEDYYFNQLLREYCQGIPSFQTEVQTTAYSGKKEVVTRKKLCDAIGSHIGRKTNISYLFALDVPAPEIIGRSGHTDYTTLMIYAQKLDDIKAEVRELDFFALPN